MSLALYFDEHLHRAIYDGLLARGVDVLRVQDDGFASASDEAILVRALELDRVVVTNDADFLAMYSKRAALEEACPGTIYVRQQRLTIGDCIRELLFLCETNDSADLHGQLIYLSKPEPK